MKTESIFCKLVKKVYVDRPKLIRQVYTNRFERASMERDESLERLEKPETSSAAAEMAIRLSREDRTSTWDYLASIGPPPAWPVRPLDAFKER